MPDRLTVRTQYVGKIVDLLVSTDALKSHELQYREKIGVDEDVHDGPVDLPPLQRIL